MAIEHAAADHHGPLAVALAVAPADDAAEQGAPKGLLLADELAREIGGIAAQGRGGMELAGQGEHRCLAAVQLAGDGGTQMPESIRAHQGGMGRNGQLAAVRGQHPADLVDHQAVLMLILVGGQQIPGQRLVLLRLARPSGGARQGVGEHLSPADPQQQLRAGAQQATRPIQGQREVEGVGVLGHQPGQDLLGIGGLVQGKDQLARQHHLGESSLGERIQGGAHRGLKFGGGRGALHRNGLVRGLGAGFALAALAALNLAGHIEAGGFGGIEGEGADQQGVDLACGPGGRHGRVYLPCQQGPFTGWRSDRLTQIIGPDLSLVRREQDVGGRSLTRRAGFHHLSIHFTPIE